MQGRRKALNKALEGQAIVHKQWLPPPPNALSPRSLLTPLMTCMLVGLHVPTNFQMYRQNSGKNIIGGGGELPPCPPPPPPATLVLAIHCFILILPQISIGVQANLIVFPISLLVVQFFRKSRPRKKRESRLKVAALSGKGKLVKRFKRSNRKAAYSTLEEYVSFPPWRRQDLSTGRGGGSAEGTFLKIHVSKLHFFFVVAHLM